MKEVSLDVTTSATFSALGIATAQLGPMVYGHTWRIRRMVTKTTSLVRTELRVYLNGVGDTNLVAGTYNANMDFNETDVTLQNLDKLYFVWSLGTVATIATIKLQGLITDAR